MYACLDCQEKFEEQDAKIKSHGTGAVLSKVELFACPECDSENIKDEETGKIQGV